MSAARRDSRDVSAGWTVPNRRWRRPRSRWWLNRRGLGTRRWGSRWCPAHTRFVDVGRRPCARCGGHPEGATALTAKPGASPGMTTTPEKPTAAAPAANRTPAVTATGRRSPACKGRKNRNGNPISSTVRADGRRVVSWYPSGVAGVGKRMQSGRPNQRAALAKAAALEPGLTETAVKTRRRMALDAGDLHNRRATPFGEMAKELFEVMIDNNVNEGSFRAYGSNFRTWIPDDIQLVLCRDLDVDHYTSIFDALGRSHVSKPVVRNVGRTLGKLIKMGSRRKYLDANKFGSRDDRAEVLSDAKLAAPLPERESEHRRAVGGLPRRP